jgi:hypothetical protein
MKKPFSSIFSSMESYVFCSHPYILSSMKSVSCSHIIHPTIHPSTLDGTLVGVVGLGERGQEGRKADH